MYKDKLNKLVKIKNENKDIKKQCINFLKNINYNCLSINSSIIEKNYIDCDFKNLTLHKDDFIDLINLVDILYYFKLNLYLHNFTEFNDFKIEFFEIDKKKFIKFHKKTKIKLTYSSFYKKLLFLFF